MGPDVTVASAHQDAASADRIDENPDDESRDQASLFVWVMWAGAGVVAAAWALRHARRFPYADDWLLVPRITGDRGVTLEWLWSLRAEHRLVVPRLFETMLVRIAGGEFRVMVVLNLVLLASMAVVAVLTMRRVRGYTTIADAFFPFVLLTLTLPGLSWAFHFHFVSTGLIALAVLLVMTRFGVNAPAGWLWASAALLLLLLGEGAPGLALLPALCVWLALSAMRLRRVEPRQGALILGAVGVLVIGIGVYFIGYHGRSRPGASLSEAAVTAVHAATAPGGDAMSDIWPLSGVAVVLGIAATAALLVVRWRSASVTEEQRGRLIAFVCFGAALAVLLAAIGFGRGVEGWTKGLEHHYSDALFPLACWVYVVWDRFGGAMRARVGVALLVVSLASYGVNSAEVWRKSARRAHDEKAFERDLCAGTSARILARRHLRLFDTTDADIPDIVEGIEDLRAHRLGEFDCR